LARLLAGLPVMGGAVSPGEKILQFHQQDNSGQGLGKIIHSLAH